MNAKNKSILFFGISLIALFFCIYISQNNIKKTTPEGANTYLQKKFSKTENLLQQYVDSISDLKIYNINDLLNFCERNKIKENEFIFYIYQDSLLKAWSSSQISLPTILKQKFQSNSLLFIERDYVYHINNGKHSYYVLGFYMIKKWENDPDGFLSLHNFNLNSNFQQIDVQPDEGKYNILDKNGKIVFSLIFPNEIFISDDIAFIELLLWIFTFSLLILGIFWLMISFPVFSENKNLIWISLTLLIAIITNLIKVPSSIYHSNIFTSLYYASFYSSLGELFIQTYATMITALIIKRCFSINPAKIKSSSVKIWLACMLIVIVFLSYILVFVIQYSIANDSTITITPILLYNYNGLSIIIIASICSLFWALLLGSRKLLEVSYKLLQSRRTFITLVGIISLIFILLTTTIYYYFFNERPNYFIYLAVFLLFIFVICLHILYPKQISTILTQTIACTLFSFIVFFITENANNKKVEQHKEDFAQNLLLTEDPLMIYDLCEIENNIRKDNKVHYYFEKDNISKDSIIYYIHSQYLIKFIDSYRKNISLNILSSSEDKIIYKNQQKLFLKADNFSKDRNVAFIQTGMGESKYMINIVFPLLKQHSIDTAVLFIEMESLSDFIRPDFNKNPHRIENEIAQLSYAEYINDTLKSYKESTAPYKLFLSEYRFDTLYNGFRFFSDGYIHTVYQNSSNKILLLSTYKDSLFKQLSSVSFILLIFIFYSIFPSMLYFFFGRKRKYITFKGQIQRMVVYLLLGSSIVGGYLFASYTISANNNQLINNSINRINAIEQLILSVLPDTIVFNGHTMGKINLINTSYLLQHRANDINIFNLQGERIIINFDKPSYLQNLLLRIEPKALKAIGEDKKSLFMNDVTISDNKYVILYKPMRNQKGEIFAYLSYSTLARQNRLDYQLTSFFSTFLSFYGLFILIALMIGSLITQYISSSLTQISNRLATIKLKSVNEKIEWKRDDEIGQLVGEYNRLIDELELSVELLSRSERESAWKDMAQQVAHEIKNPLTPMKIRTQHLQRELNDGKANKIKLQAYTNMMLEQIEILNDITSSFSSFTKMHHGEGKKENLIMVLDNILALHANQNHYELSFVNNVQTDDMFIYINKTQIIRAFNNLIRNAIQASKPNEKQRIIIELNDYGEQMWQIKVQDFGIGMDETTQKLAFTAHFSTKSSGMGLGLVMVKNIITDWNGSISLKSIPNQGSTFILLLPKCLN